LDVVLAVFQWTHIVNEVIIFKNDVSHDYNLAIFSACETMTEDRDVASVTWVLQVLSWNLQAIGFHSECVEVTSLIVDLEGHIDIFTDLITCFWVHASLFQKIANWLAVLTGSNSVNFLCKSLIQCWWKVDIWKLWFQSQGIVFSDL
jgi:hypothetical protein